MTDRGADQPDSRAFRTGSLIAGYRLEEPIGAGGMAVVYRAYDTRLDRQVALKLLAPGPELDGTFRQRFIRESRAAAAVDHPHIIPVFDAGESDGVLFIAMRYVPDRDVRTRIDRAGRLPPGLVADIVSQVASALDAAHARGLVHRDVKPANILLEAQPADDLPDHVYLSDFGLTKGFLGNSMALTASGEFMGTVDYIAPEQIEGRPLDSRCDEYALACSAFEMLCGQPPFRRDQAMESVYAHLHQPPPRTQAYRLGLPAEVDSVLGRALAKTPADRYSSCGEFATALRQVLGSPAQGHARPGAASPGAQPTIPPISPDAAAAILARLRATQHDPVPGGPVAGGDADRTQPSSHRQHARARRTDASRVTDPSPGKAAPLAAAARHRPWRRSAALTSALTVAALVLAGGGFLLANRSHAGAATLRVPGRTQATAPAPLLGFVTSASLRVPGAFGVAVSGRYAFVSGHNAVTILTDNPSALAPARLARYSVPGVGKGDAITHDGRYLLAAAGSGAVVISTARAIAGAPPVVGRLHGSPGMSGAAEVALSPDDNYAFVTVQDNASLAVFNLREALASGFANSGFVGDVQVRAHPAGLAVAGNVLFVMNEGGEISVVSMSTAEREPARAVVHTVPAGCGPARAMVADDGQLWVTAACSDALLGFSTAKLVSDPAHALIARVLVGEQPLGLALIAGGAQIVVVDSDQSLVHGKFSSLAVVDTRKALDGQPAVIGYIPTGALPREAALEQDGRTLLVTVTNSGRVQAVDLRTLRVTASPP